MIHKKNKETNKAIINQLTIEMTEYNQQHTDFYLCNDTLNIMVNFLPLIDICSIKLLNKYYEKFIDTNFMLENYCHSSANQKIIQKHRNYLKKIIIYSDVNISNDIFLGCNKLWFIDLSRNKNLTDEGLEQFKDIGIHTLYLNNNKNITSKGMKHLTGISTFIGSKVIIGSEAYEQFNRHSGLINSDLLIGSKIATDEGINFILGILHH